MADLLDREDAGDVEPVVQVLVDNRLLTTSRDPLTGSRFVEISHEALIRGWATLGEWIQAERDWLREHRRLADAAHDWRQRGDEELLYRGTRLVDVARLRAGHAADLSRDEEEFLAHSARLEGAAPAPATWGRRPAAPLGPAWGTVPPSRSAS